MLLEVAPGLLRHEETGKLLKEQLQLFKSDEGRYRLKQLPRALGFDKGFYVCVRALQLLVQQNQGCIVVAVAGASGSGKTTFCGRLEKLMNNVTVLSMDMYNDGSKVMEDNFDDPRIIDYDCLIKNLDDLRSGRPTKAPIYDFKTSTRIGYRDVEVPESRVVIIEGIYALSQRLEHYVDLKIAIRGGVHFDLVKRVMRDIQRSGQGAGEVIQQVSDTVYPMYKAFIERDLESAEIKIDNSFNPFAGFKEPVQILKTSDCVSVEAAYDVLQRLYPNAEVSQSGEIEVHDIFLLPPGEDPQGCQSWLRMRNKEGRYSLMFAEYVVSDPFIVSPRVSFEVPVRILGGLMALGYTIGSIMSRTTFQVVCKAKAADKPSMTVKWDKVEKLGCFVQVQGDSRSDVREVCEQLGITTFVPRSYIEQVQLLQLTDDFAQMTEKARRHFTVVDGGALNDHASPPRLLLRTPQPSPSRHSVDGSMLGGTITRDSNPLHEPAALSAPGVAVGSAVISDPTCESLLPALENSGQMRALSHDEKIPVEEMSKQWAVEQHALGNNCNSATSNGITAQVSPAHPRTVTKVISNSISIDGSQCTVRPALAGKAPSFWSPMKTPQPGPTASGLAYELKSITRELHVIAENTGRQNVTSASLCSLLLGLSAGVAITLALTRKS